MNTHEKRLGLLLTIAAVLLIVGTVPAGCAPSEDTTSPNIDTDAPEQGFARFGLTTDTSKRSVELDEFVSGGPNKDDIPALVEPEFVSLDDSEVPDDVRGVLVEIGGESRFYPYNIMVWHEIANDVIAGKAIAVTF